MICRKEREQKRGQMDRNMKGFIRRERNRDKELILGAINRNILEIGQKIGRNFILFFMVQKKNKKKIRISGYGIYTWLDGR